MTLDGSYKVIRALGAPGLVGPTDAAIATADMAYFRNVTGGAGMATPASFDIQCCLGGTDTDATPTSGTEIHWSVIVRAF